MSTTIEVQGKTPIFLFKQECVDCTHLNAAGKKTFKCHYAIPNSQGQVNEDCPASEHYLVIGFNPERVSSAYVKATSVGNNRKVIAIVQAVNNQHEEVQEQFWSQVHYKTALQLGAVGFDETADEQPTAQQNQNDVVQNHNDMHQAQLAGQPLQVAQTSHQQGQGFEIEVPAAAGEQPADPYAAEGNVDSNEWNEE